MSRIGVLVLVIGLVLAACTSGTTKHGAARSDRSEQSCGRLESLAGRMTSEPDPAAGVRRVRLTFVDRSRSTPAVPGRPAVSCRVLPTEIRTPKDVDRRAPLIVVAHGLDGDPTSLGPLLDAWSAAGYVVVAPTFPATEKDARGTSLPVENPAQAADISFLIDSLLEPQTAATTKLRDRIDASTSASPGCRSGDRPSTGSSPTRAARTNA
jgi:predicted dienelactone hydrolase